MWNSNSTDCPTCSFVCFLVKMATLAGLAPPFPLASGTTYVPTTSQLSFGHSLPINHINLPQTLTFHSTGEPCFSMPLASPSCFGISVTIILALPLYQTNAKPGSLPHSARPTPPYTTCITRAHPFWWQRQLLSLPLSQHLTSHPGQLIFPETCLSHHTFSTSILPAAIFF